MEEQKTNESGRAGAKAAYIVKKYRLGRRQYGETEYFVLDTDHPDFEKLIGRGSGEIFSPADYVPAEIPLGETAIDAVIALYGLTNSALYGDSLFKESYPVLPFDKARDVADLLRAAAYEKYDTRHWQSNLCSTSLERVLTFQRIRPCDIVEEFRYLRG